MAACSDPYRELELYLEKAQDEIGKAFEELLQHEITSAYKSSDVETVLPPPPAFRSLPGHTLCCNNVANKANPVQNGSKNTMSRVCYDGTLLDLQNSSSERHKEGDSLYLLQKSLSCSAAFPESKELSMANGHREFGTNCSLYSSGKLKPKPFRSALSFPEGAMDSILNNMTLNKCVPYPCTNNNDSNSIKINEEIFKLSSSQSVNETLPSSNNLRYRRQRSYSETSPPKTDNFNTEDHFYTFPRPPSGDVNLLSIWADNLVLEIDRTMPLELDDSVGSYSPLSDYSLSPVKNEDDVLRIVLPSSDDKSTAFRSCTGEQENNLSQTNLCKSNISNHFKSMSPSPDSGIGPILYELLEIEHTVDGTSKKPVYFCSMSNKMAFSEEQEVDTPGNITAPPPPGSQDAKHGNNGSKLNTCHRGSSNNFTRTPINTKEAKTQVRLHALKVATCVTVQTDKISEKENISKETHRHARVIPSTSVDFEDCATITTLCAVSDASWNGTVFKSLEDYLKNQSQTPQSVSSALSDCYLSVSGTIIDDVFEDADQIALESVFENSSTKEPTLHFSTLPKPVTCVKDADRYSCSLPRDAGRPPPDNKNIVDTPQRSASSSAMSSVSQVSMEELADFMRKVKTSTYLPPPSTDVSVTVKDTNDEDTSLEEWNRDAVTQTTPIVPLSRSSSFTWVTECDCSDWDSSNPRSESEDSWLAFSLSNVTSEKKVPPSSSSGSTDDDGCDPPQNSDCSSLYLSACSEACDSNASDSSFHDSKTPETVSSTTGLLEHGSLPLSPGKLSFKGDVKSLPSGGILMDIAEEDVSSIEVPRISAISSFPKDVTISAFASLPSTLKSANNTYQGQPIEAKVLIVNEAESKSLPTVILRPKKHSSARKRHVSSSKNLPSSNAGSESGSVSQNQFCDNVTGLSLTAAEAEEIELQALEACRWLRATGFPQYAQMYEDDQFPVNICTVKEDHEFLHQDSIQSLFRRLNTLNRCVRMKLVTSTGPRKPVQLELDESDEEEQCALSEKWQFQRNSRRWSRVVFPPEAENESSNCNIIPPVSPRLTRHLAPPKNYLIPEEPCSSSHDSVFVEEQHSSPDSIRRSATKGDEQLHPIHTFQNSPGSSSGSGGTLSVGSEDTHEKGSDSRQKNLHRSGSDRIKEGAKALLRRMESLKGKGKKKVIAKLHLENAKDISPPLNINNGMTSSSCTSSVASSPMVNRSPKVQVCSPQNTPDFSKEGTPQMNQRRKGWNSFYKNEQEASAYSDSECPVFLVSEPWDEFTLYETQGPGTSSSPQTMLKVPEISTGRLTVRNHNSRTSVSKESQSRKVKCDKKASHFSNPSAPLAVFNNAYVDSIGRETGHSKTLGPSVYTGYGENDGEIIIINHERRDSGVGASLTRSSGQTCAPWHSFPEKPISDPKFNQTAIPIETLSAPQMLLLHKLSMLKLTTIMERFSPSSRSGWSWVFPKFLRRTRTPDYKEKEVFGVPLLVVLQRTGKALPDTIEAAIHYLRSTALSSIGLFRKSGVRSRIQRLRTLNETCSEVVNYDDHQPYDVADMLKQYFRELPEALLTNKLSETFISIFLNIPAESRFEAIRATFFIMPDENREVLLSLLAFLREVCQHSDENQMTATNLAVCFAPSLFHLSPPRSANVSPRQRKAVGAPDIRELNENRAAYECLSWMVMHYEDLTTVTRETFDQSPLPYIDEYEPASLDELSSILHKDYHGWRAYIEGCIQALLKESKDRYKGWISFCQVDNIDLSCKKLPDGHLLRLWKITTDIEAPPIELLHRILREQSTWDRTFLDGKIVQSLDKQTEIYRYACSSIPPHPHCDFCVIRSWKTDLPKGACVLIEASISHPGSPIVANGVRGVILASRYLIEPCGSGKSRVTHISRVDTKGRSPEWYNCVYGHLNALNFMKLRDSFRRRMRPEGPETKV